MINRNDPHLSISNQCKLLQLHRSGLYYTPCAESEENLNLMRMMDEQYHHTPFYGLRRLRRWLHSKGYKAGKKRVKRLMKLIDWQTIYRKPNTSWKNKAHSVYPYLLKNRAIERTNQAWAIDITYVPMRRGFMYLCAIIDLHTRYIVNWSISNTMSAKWCAELVEEAIKQNGVPELINSDQGSQFTSFEYIDLLKNNNIAISMDGKGRAIDNIFIERFWKSVKYECLYLNAFEDGVELYQGLEKYFQFYNHERGHQSLKYETPAEKFFKAA